MGDFETPTSELSVQRSASELHAHLKLDLSGGFEPPSSDSKSEVLPLDEERMKFYVSLKIHSLLKKSNASMIVGGINLSN